MNIHNWWVFITALILSPMAYYATIVQIGRRYGTKAEDLAVIPAFAAVLFVIGYMMFQ